MDDLVQWLNAQYDEDERIARGVSEPPDWHQGPGDDPEWTDEEMVCMWPPEFHTPFERDKHWRGLTVPGEELAAFIAAHDPARVLREIDSKRRILTQCAYWNERAVEEAVDPPKFPQPGLDLGLLLDAMNPVLRLLALPYSDREGYRPEWAPTE